MLPRIVALLLVLIMIVPAFARTTVQDQFAKWKLGQRIEVTRMSGEKITGRLGPVQPQSFILEPIHKTQSSREIRFDDVRSVTTKWTTRQKWIAALIVYGAATIAFSIMLGK